MASITVTPVARGASARETRFVNARSALFDIYGDHLLSRGEEAPVAALVRLVEPLRISAPAVRTAVSRMARQGWLEPLRLPGGAGYRLTPRAVQRLREAADRIYRRDTPPWDGRWHVVVVERVRQRAARERLRSALGYLGYACLEGSTWISPRPSTELDAVLIAEHIGADRFDASYDGDARRLAARAWDIDGLARGYREWLTRASDIVSARRGIDDEEVFAMRSELVHEWRKFLFVDPGLPAELLPARWPGKDAAELFHAQAERMLPAAARFVDCCLAGARDNQATGNGRRT
ncbi:MAG TPA: PaaX family transcriptional regulator C-terminal domain-containing protein [Streptosporangiaceae bacterium]